MSMVEDVSKTDSKGLRSEKSVYDALLNLRKSFGRSAIVSLMVLDTDVVFLTVRRPREDDYTNVHESDYGGADDPLLFKNYFG